MGEVWFYLCNVAYISSNRLLWSRGSVLVFSTQVRGFKPGQSRRSHVVDLRDVKDP